MHCIKLYDWKTVDTTMAFLADSLFSIERDGVLGVLEIEYDQWVLAVCCSFCFDGGRFEDGAYCIDPHGRTIGALAWLF